MSVLCEFYRTADFIHTILFNFANRNLSISPLRFQLNYYNVLIYNIMYNTMYNIMYYLT